MDQNCIKNDTVEKKLKKLKKLFTNGLKRVKI